MVRYPFGDEHWAKFGGPCMVELATDLTVREVARAAETVLGRSVHVTHETDIARDLAVDSLAKGIGVTDASALTAGALWLGIAASVGLFVVLIAISMARMPATAQDSCLRTNV